ncbi:DUF2339 domain-containing protein [Candidatus Uhrbacteria bacterium]|nr:DUF2339 domain-containing protein [Candidatus Uhrbacteria bacterium]
MDFIILLLGIGFAYLLWSLKKLEERIDKLSPKTHVPATKPIYEAPSASAITHHETPSEAPADRPALEFKMGAWVYTAVGGIALLLGLGFLLRFAIENNLISPALRVALGLVLGGILAGIGYWLEARMRNFAHILLGTGLGAWYLSLYAATMVYNLVPVTVGFVLVCGVTVAGIALALRFNTQSLAVFAMVGGFLTPFLLDAPAASPHAFFIYLILLNAVMLALSWFKPWRILPGLSFVGTILSYSAWYYGNGDVTWSIPFTYLAILFLGFFGRSLLRILKGKLDPADYTLLCSNPIFFFAALSGLHPENIEGRYWAAGLAVAFALLHLTVAMWRERVAFIGIGSLFLAIAAPLYFKDNRWFLLAWTFEALVLGIVADKLKSRGLDLLSHLLFGFAAVGIIDALGTAAGNMPWINLRMFLLVLAIAAFTVMAWYDEHKRMNEHHAKRPWLSTAHLLVTYALILIAITSEISAFYQPDQTLWMATASVVLGSLAIMGGLWIGSFALRVTGITTIGIAGLIAIIDALTSSPEQIFFSPRVLALLVCAAVVGTVRVYLRSADNGLGKDESDFLKPATWLAANTFLIFLVSMEAVNGVKILGGTSQTGQVALSVAWLVYGIALVIYGILGKSILSRGTALALFGIVIAKILLIDTAELDNFARFVTFISLGGVLLVSGFLYNKFKARIEG